MGLWDRELERTRQVIDELGPWAHNVRLPNGIDTAPDAGEEAELAWKAVARSLPHDLEGTTALDLGCASGFYSFALAARGAKVLGIEGEAHFLEQARWLRKKLAMRENVRFRHAPIYSLAKRTDSYDVVTLMGGLARLRYPMLAVDIAAEHATKQVVIHSPAWHDVISGDEEVPWDVPWSAVKERLEEWGFVMRRAGQGAFIGIADSKSTGQPVDFLAATGRPWRARRQEIGG